MKLKDLINGALGVTYSFVKLLIDFEARVWAKDLAGSHGVRVQSIIENNERISALRRSWLTRVVRRFPYWSGGHLALGEIGLRQGDLGLAYASAHAVAVLEISGELKALSNYILGKCFLLKREYESALEFLTRASVIKRPEVQEDLAACLMALGDNKAAFEAISSINLSDLSPEGRAVYDFLQARYNV